MSVTIITTPDDLTPIGNPITFVVSSPNVAQPNFMFVCDIFVNGDQVSRLKCFPNPTTDKGYFNIRETLRSQIGINTDIGEGRGFQCPDMWVEYEVQFSEQFTGSSAVTTDWTGTTYCGAINTLDFPLFDYSQYVCTEVIGPNPVKLLTNRPQSTKAVCINGVYLQSGYLYIPCNITTLPNIDAIQYTYYDRNGGLMRQFFFNTWTFPFHNASDPNDNSVITVPFMPNEVYNIPSGYTQDGQDGAHAFPFDEGYYSIQLFKEQTSGMYHSEEYFVYLTEECTRFQFTEIHFQNQLGGVDSYVFTKPNREVQNITRTQASTPLVLPDGDYYRYNINSSSKFNTNIEWEKEFQLQSDWLNDDEFNWLQELVRSPRVWIRYTYNNDGTPAETLLPILITNTTYNVWKRDFDKLQSLTINYKLCIDQTSPL